MMTKKILTWLVFTALACSFFSIADAAETTKVAVIPFKMNADRDLSYLRDGIVDMLTTRLSWGKKVVVLPKEQVQQALQGVDGPVNEEAARQTGERLGADFVLFGSVTVFGESVSMDAKMVDVTGQKATVSVFNQSKGMDEVIPKVNEFAADINESVFGRATNRPQKVVSQARQQPQSPGIYAHPEKLLGYPVDEQEGSSLNPSFIVTGRSRRSSFRARYKVDHYVKSLSIGDVDGDGAKEIVFVSQTTIFIYRNVGGRFVKVKEIEGKASDSYLGVDVADINKNNAAEIFVTNLSTSRNALESFVLEWNGSDFIKISDDNNWYYRVLELPLRGRVLHGQKRGVSDAFLPGIHELDWQGGEYASVSQIRSSSKYNVFGIMFADVLSEGSDRTLIFDNNDYLQVLTPSGDREWKSDEPYGGSETFVTTSAGTLESKKEEDKPRIFLSQRILVKDLDNDGHLEIIVVKNHAPSSRLLTRFRSFTNAEILDLSWDGLGFTQNWKTPTIPDYVSDIAIDDFDNDGQDELVAVMVKAKGAAILLKPTSYIIWYDLVKPEKKEGE